MNRLTASIAIALGALALFACDANKPIQPKGVYLPEGVPESANATADNEESSRKLVDALVGQVNGQPVYVSTVIDKEMNENMTRLGEELSRGDFRDRAEVMIHERLSAITARRLMLGEAERTLTPQEEMGVRVYLQERREELIAEWGGGILSQAEKTLQREKGMSLEQMLEDERQDAVIKTFINRTILPKVTVSRREMERHYAENIEKYRPPAGRTFRLIRVGDTVDANRVDVLLKQGVPFTEVASKETGLNTFSTETEGLMSPTDKEDPFAIPALNEAAKSLQVGQHSPRITEGQSYLWLYLESVTSPEGKSFEEVQLDIAQELRLQQYNQLLDEYYEELRRTGATDPLLVMQAAVLETAMNRYARPE